MKHNQLLKSILHVFQYDIEKYLSGNCHVGNFLLEKAVLNVSLLKITKTVAQSFVLANL